MADPTLTVNVDTPSAAGGLGYMILGTGLLGTGTLAPDVIYADKTSKVRSLSIKRGMTNPSALFFRPDAGTCDILFDDRDRTMDPNANSDITPGRAVQIQITYSATTYDLFTGTVDNWKPDYPAYGKDATVSAAANDGISTLSQLPTSQTAGATFPSELTGSRVRQIANLIGWPNALRDFDAGNTTMEVGPATASALAALFAAADSEMGQVYVDTDGTLVFRSRDAQVTETRSVTSQATFGDQGSELPYQAITPVVTDKTNIVNQVKVVYNTNGDSATATDTSSVTSYGPRAAPPITISCTDKNIAAAYARFVVGLSSTPTVRFSSITIRPGKDWTNLAPQAFGRKLGDRITVKNTPPGGGSRLSEDCFIVGIQHDSNASQSVRAWTTTFYLMDATNWPSAFILGTSALGGSQTLWW